jgi:hypothetical protein
MSLGSSFKPPTDQDAVAADNAAAIGIVVVCSAGNNGNTHYIVGGPSVADAAISVAASTITDTIGSFSSRGPRGPDSHLGIVSKSVDGTTKPQAGLQSFRKVGKQTK